MNQRLISKIRERVTNLWHEKRRDTGNEVAEIWLQAVTEGMQQAGFDILSDDLLASERSLISDGLVSDYVDELVAITRATPENLMPLITATSQQRAMAVKTVRAYQASTTSKEIN